MLTELKTAVNQLGNLSGLLLHIVQEDFFVNPIPSMGMVYLHLVDSFMVNVVKCTIPMDGMRLAKA